MKAFIIARSVIRNGVFDFDLDLKTQLEKECSFFDEVIDLCWHKMVNPTNTKNKINYSNRSFPKQEWLK